MSLSIFRWKHINRAAGQAELAGTRLGLVVTYVASNTQSTLGSSPTNTSTGTCYNNIFNQAVASGYSTPEADQIASAAVAAYLFNIQQTGNTASAAQAATGAAIAKAIAIAMFEYLQDPGAMLEAVAFAAAMGAYLGAVSTSNQQTEATNALIYIAGQLGFSL